MAHPAAPSSSPGPAARTATTRWSWPASPKAATARRAPASSHSPGPRRSSGNLPSGTEPNAMNFGDRVAADLRGPPVRPAHVHGQLPERPFRAGRDRHGSAVAAGDQRADGRRGRLDAGRSSPPGPGSPPAHWPPLSGWAASWPSLRGAAASIPSSGEPGCRDSPVRRNGAAPGCREQALVTGRNGAAPGLPLRDLRALVRTGPLARSPPEPPPGRPCARRRSWPAAPRSWATGGSGSPSTTTCPRSRAPRPPC